MDLCCLHEPIAVHSFVVHIVVDATRFSVGQSTTRLIPSGDSPSETGWWWRWWIPNERRRGFGFGCEGGLRLRRRPRKAGRRRRSIRSARKAFLPAVPIVVTAAIHLPIPIPIPDNILVPVVRVSVLHRASDSVGNVPCCCARGVGVGVGVGIGVIVIVLLAGSMLFRSPMVRVCGFVRFGPRKEHETGKGDPDPHHALHRDRDPKEQSGADNGKDPPGAVECRVVNDADPRQQIRGCKVVAGKGQAISDGPQQIALDQGHKLGRGQVRCRPRDV
mmetsp:Transcript_18480/g.51564  ORF Transcript_18480/g.51564 Transcript_18480/m.51564 type:complete len:275 (+) Transcript_18480:744-1568(+)